METQATLVLTEGEQEIKRIEGTFISDDGSDERLKNGKFKFKAKTSDSYTGSGLNLLSEIGYKWYILLVNDKRLTATSETGTNFGVDGE